MKTIEVIHVRGDDWQGLYFDGKLAHEGHTLHLGQVLASITELNAPIVYRVVYAYEDWLMDVGSLPDDLTDVPLRSL